MEAGREVKRGLLNLSLVDMSGGLLWKIHLYDTDVWISKGHYMVTSVLRTRQLATPSGLLLWEANQYQSPSLQGEESYVARQAYCFLYFA